MIDDVLVSASEDESGNYTWTTPSAGRWPTTMPVASAKKPFWEFANPFWELLVIVWLCQSYVYFNFSVFCPKVAELMYYFIIYVIIMNFLVIVRKIILDL